MALETGVVGLCAVVVDAASVDVFHAGLQYRRYVPEQVTCCVLRVSVLVVGRRRDAAFGVCAHVGI